MKKLMLGFVVLLSLMFTGCSFFYESASITVINNTTDDYKFAVDYNGSMKKDTYVHTVWHGDRSTSEYDCLYFKSELEDRGGDTITFYYCDDDKFDEVEDSYNSLFRPTDLGILKQSDKTGYTPVVHHNGSISDHYTITINPGKNIQITY